MNFKESLNGYLHWLEVNGYAKETIRSRRNCLRKFIADMNTKNIDDPKLVAPQDTEKYFVYLKTEYCHQGKPLSNIAVSNYITSIAGFFKWLEETKRILMTPVINRPTVPRLNRIPVVLTEEETVKILESVSINTPTGIRNRAILELLYSTGIRRGELVNLNVEDFIPERGELTIIKGKGAKDRVVPVGEVAATFLQGYLSIIRPWQAKPEEPALFVNSATGERLNGDWIRLILWEAVKRSGVQKRVTPHTLRHSMATHLLRNKADLRHIQAILGHATLRTTQVYTHLTLDDLKRAIKENHPHGKRNPKS